MRCYTEDAKLRDVFRRATSRDGFRHFPQHTKEIEDAFSSSNIVSGRPSRL